MFCHSCKFSERAPLQTFQISNERPFHGWRRGGAGVSSFKPGRSLNFSAVKRGAHSKGVLIKTGVLFQIITVFLLFEVCHICRLEFSLACPQFLQFVLTQVMNKFFGNHSIVSLCLSLLLPMLNATNQIFLPGIIANNTFQV